MNKVKKFLLDNKKEMKVLAYGASMMAFGFYFGVKMEEGLVAKGLENMAKSGKKLNTVIDNEFYIMSIVKEQIDK